MSASPSKAEQLERWIGLKAHFAEPFPNPSVDLYFFDGGYCGVQPVEVNDAHSGNGRVNACAMVRADVASTLPDVFARHDSLRERSLRWQPLSDPVSTSPLIFRKPQLERDSQLHGSAKYRTSVPLSLPPARLAATFLCQLKQAVSSRGV